MTACHFGTVRRRNRKFLLVDGNAIPEINGKLGPLRCSEMAKIEELVGHT